MNTLFTDDLVGPAPLERLGDLRVLRRALRCRWRERHRNPGPATRANAICERVIGTIRPECLDKMPILGRRHLDTVLAEYVEQYNAHRPHHFLDQRSPSALDAAPVPIHDIDPTKYEAPNTWAASSTSTE